MKPITTAWEYSITTEAQRILHAARQMAIGFYRINNFYVLPFGHPLADTATVLFPDLPYHQIPRFWEKVKKINADQFPIPADNNLMSAITNLLTPIWQENINFKTLQNTWKKAHDEILRTIYSLIPNKKGAITGITIYPTQFGTTCSVSWPKKFPGEIKMYLRQDQDIYAICEMILTALTRQEIYDKLDGLWSESEILVDWLLTYSSLADVLKKCEPHASFAPTMKLTREKQKAKLFAESEKFYRKLGLPIKGKMFDLNGKILLINDKKVQNLSFREQQILSLMIQKGNGIVSLDEVGKILNADEENFSLWSIAKAIQRLRNKLELNGISGSYIQTLRRQGYLLKN